MVSSSSQLAGTTITGWKGCSLALNIALAPSYQRFTYGMIHFRGRDKTAIASRIKSNIGYPSFKFN
jgi:hypothetical protein